MFIFSLCKRALTIIYNQECIFCWFSLIWFFHLFFHSHLNIFLYYILNFKTFPYKKLTHRHIKYKFKKKRKKLMEKKFPTVWFVVINGKSQNENLEGITLFFPLSLSPFEIRLNLSNNQSKRLLKARV